MNTDHNNTIKEVFDSKYFHGRLTDEEAFNLCKEEMNNTELEDGRLQGTIRGYQRDSGLIVLARGFRGVAHLHFWRLYMHVDNVVERKNPITLLELARVATLDNLHGY